MINQLVACCWTAWLAAAAHHATVIPGSASDEERDRDRTLRPLSEPTVPPLDDSFITNPIDAFVLAGLRESGLSPSPPADARTLRRRLARVLTGLPATDAEVRAFEADPSRAAFDGVVQTLLHSQAHAERWAQHWLDVARFAETHGFETNTPREGAWRYRDWVVQALADDLPFADFIRQQLAGDVADADAATGFLVAGPWDSVKSPDEVLTANQRDAELHDMVSTTASVFLGMTVGCAKCHDHKFDPVTQHEYFALRACFEGVQHGSREVPPADAATRNAEAVALDARLTVLEAATAHHAALAVPAPAPGASPRRRPVRSLGNLERFAPVRARALRFTVHATNSVEPCIDELEVFEVDTRQNVALATFGTRASASSEYPNSAIHRIVHLNDGRVGNGRSWISHEVGGGWAQLDFPREVHIDTVRWARDRERRFADRTATDYDVSVSVDGVQWMVVASSADRLPFGHEDPGADPATWAEADEASRKRMVEDAAEFDRERLRRESLRRRPMAYVGRFDDQPPATRLLHRGDPMKPGNDVAPGVPACTGLPFPTLAHDAPESARRLALAAWIADPRNPRAARVLVNRVWQHHFGQGLVATPSDFGVMGSPCSHPDLLDWLALRFLESGGSVRALHRLIVESSTWRQASLPRDDALAVDAQSRLLWRFPPRRLDAEAVRDGMLAQAGLLDSRVGGPGVSAFAPNENYVRVYRPKSRYEPGDFRRMLYMTRVRMERDDTFGLFDRPDAARSCPKRASSTTPLQSMALLHSPFVLQVCDALAAHLHEATGDEPGAQVRAAFSCVHQRPPDSDEFDHCRELVERHGLAALCRVLFNTNEFVFLD